MRGNEKIRFPISTSVTRATQTFDLSIQFLSYLLPPIKLIESLLTAWLEFTIFDSLDFREITGITSLFIRIYSPFIRLIYRSICAGSSPLCVVSSILGADSEREAGDGQDTDTSLVRGGSQGADRLRFHGGRLVRKGGHRIRHVAGGVCQIGPGSDRVRGIRHYIYKNWLVQ